MISLYESILSSTKSGSSATANKIAEWWTKFYSDKGNFSVELIDGKFFVIIDDFGAQPRQGTVQIGPGPFGSMPKDLAGIYYYKYTNKETKSLAVPKLTFSFLKGVKIDLSKWDLSKNEEPTSILDLHIQFYGCHDLRIIGLPKYKDVFNTYFVSGSDNRMSRVNAPSCNVSIHDDDTKITNLNDCNVRELIISYKNFEGNFGFRPYLVSTRCTYISDENWQQELDRLFDNNKIEVLRYQPSSGTDTKLMNKNLKIVPNKNKTFERMKYKMIDL